MFEQRGQDHQPEHCDCEANDRQHVPRPERLLSPDVAEFSPEEMHARLAAARAFMRERNLAALLVYGAGRNAEIEYLSAWPGTREAHLVVPADAEPRLFVQLFNHAPNAARVSVVPSVWGGPNSAESVAAYLREVAVSTIGVIGGLPFQDFLRLHQGLPKLQLEDVNRDWRMLRAIKSPAEIEQFRIAAAYTDDAMDALLSALRPGVTEHELEAAIEYAYRPRGGTVGIHFMTSMPMDAPTTGVPGQIQTERALQRGDVLITEISAGYGPYMGQIHRTYFVGCEPSAAWRRVHEVAVETFERIERVLRDGVELDAVLDAADYVHEQGLTIFDDLLHGANQYPPIIKTRRTSHSNPKSFTFRENMVVVIQPNVIMDDSARIGLQFGETLRITRDGTERLHRLPREYFVV
jgi:Xaa-Pro aminopeptidase